jgi:mono/diheme cytochrome c family protein
MKLIQLLLATSLIATACGTKSTDESSSEMGHNDQVKMEQYVVAGEILYAQYCANCHQADGNGLAELYPPLNASDYLEENLESLSCIIKNGIQGEVVVNGVTYNQVMPGLGMLTDLEIAEISTFVANAWENDMGFIGVKDVTDQLKNCE